ncbi:MAG: YARHG domain-containing protein [Lachnospiraceae bacterium]|nr:YARHG domain-containing protein [Lachnospiraceae bacterium]
MKRKIITIILLCGLVITGCEQENNNETKENQKDAVTAQQEQENNKQTQIKLDDTTDYSRYDGSWTTDGICEEDLLENGGTELTLTITNGNQVSGSLLSQQNTSNCIANIDFFGEIKDDQLIYSFTDDGFGDTGTLNFVFKDNEIDLNVTDYVLSEDNPTGWGISGSYIFFPSSPSKKSSRNNCSFYPEITNYLEAHGRTDASITSEPLFDTDRKYYTSEDFADAPKSVLRIAKNEIYARHGYIFNDSDLNNYFSGMDWYTPSINATDFSDTVFNEYEKANLKLLNDM